MGVRSERRTAHGQGLLARGGQQMKQEPHIAGMLHKGKVDERAGIFVQRHSVWPSRSQVPPPSKLKKDQEAQPTPGNTRHHDNHHPRPLPPPSPQVPRYAAHHKQRYSHTAQRSPKGERTDHLSTPSRSLPGSLLSGLNVVRGSTTARERCGSL